MRTMWTVLYLRALLGVVLLLAAVAKRGDRSRFVRVIRNYRLVPDRVAAPLARVLPESEAVLGLTLLVGAAPAVAATAAACLFVTFAGAVAINLLRGRSSIACGCFGPSEHDALSWGHVVQNVAFAAGAVYTMLGFHPQSVPLERVDVLSATAAALITVACWWLATLARRLLRTAGVDAEAA
jgi:hypothetical protein